jgi:hypothetical protein
MFVKGTVLLITLLLLASAVDVRAGNGCAGVYFKTIKTEALSTPVFGPYIVDFDHDGFKDLMGSTSNGFAYYKGSVNGFDTPPVFTNDGSVYFIMYGDQLSADFNNDGKLDLVGQTIGDVLPKFAIYLNNGNGSFTRSTETQAVRVDNSETIVGVTDFTGDGRPDLLVQIGSSGPVLYLRKQNKDGTFGNATFLPVASPKNLLIRDLNNDGKMDFVYTMWSATASIRTMMNQGNGTFVEGGAIPVEPATYYPNNFIAVDIDSDGKTDIVSGVYARNIVPPYFFSIFRFGPTGAITQTEFEVPATSFGVSLAAPRAADFDGDGVTDLAFFSPNGNVVAKNHGNLQFSLGVTATSGDHAPFVSEFTTDTKADLLSPNYFNLGGYRVESVSYRKNVCAPPGQTKFVDFDGNGLSDFVFWRASDGMWRRYPPPFQEPVEVQWGLGSLGDIPVPQDYDGDGFTDYAVYRATTGYWYIVRSSDGQIVINHFGGVSGDKPIPADYDGDGSADLAVFRPSEGNWYWWPSGSPEKMVGTHWGLDGDVPLPMDYSGDGSADVAIYRQSQGAWYIWCTDTGQYIILTFGGLPGDTPVPADYDKDGKADLALWRPHGVSNGIDWFIATSRYLYGTQVAPAGNIQPFVANGGGMFQPGPGPLGFRASTSSMVSGTSSSLPFPGNGGNRNASWILPLE